MERRITGLLFRLKMQKNGKIQGSGILPVLKAESLELISSKLDGYPPESSSKKIGAQRKSRYFPRPP
ncbi:hypothetical protein AKJ62_04630 [candidate division MSBL1 archaeon SCGC-AAA259D14]|uniref:Uncharacterized protein n=1 Tax=candidate division MSBL1 archaeon SCGC-AAA259D14 TaxID=1698261 RepID=A0A133U3F4_9EURY|nr:hypothetical protein AKJ62_04630 [candidate division MSBL1 archaeon SCGC-AAA259D14]